MGERWSGREETHLVAKEDDEPRMDAKRQRLEWEAAIVVGHRNGHLRSGSGRFEVIRLC